MGKENVENRFVRWREYKVALGGAGFQGGVTVVKVFLRKILFYSCSFMQITIVIL